MLFRTAYKNNYLLMSDQKREISTVNLKGLPAQEVWDLVMKDKLSWLKHFYQQKSTGNNSQEPESNLNNQQFNKIQTLFQELKHKIKHSNFNKEGQYFIKFKQIQQNKYFSKSIYLNPIKLKPKSQDDKKIEALLEQLWQEQKSEVIKNSFLSQTESQSLFQKNVSSTDIVQFQKAYKALMLQNHKKIIDYLTKERYSFCNVAMHIYQKKDQEQNGFFFFVERGRQMLQSPLHIVLLYIFIRDLTIGLIELQQHLILHLDVDQQNILLFLHNYPNGSQKLKGLNLNSPQQIKEVIQALRFKIIDFGDAMILDNSFKVHNYNLMRNRFNETHSITSNLFNKEEIDQQAIVKAISLKENKQQIKKIIRSIHANFFRKCLSKMSGKIQNIDKYDQKRYQKLFSSEKQDDYKQIIAEMEKEIQQFKK